MAATLLEEALLAAVAATLQEEALLGASEATLPWFGPVPVSCAAGFPNFQACT